MMKQLIDHPDFGAVDLSSLQNLSYGGAAMPFPVIRRAIERFPKTVGFVNAFGQTETTSTLTVLGPDDHRLDGGAGGGRAQAQAPACRSAGRCPTSRCRWSTTTGARCRPSEVGELWVSHAARDEGLRRRGGDSPFTADGWLPTRDMGWIDEDGYIFLAGRKDDMIIRGGENIAPAEVEAVLYSHPAVEEVAVIGLPDVEWGQRVAAVVVPRPGEDATADELGEFCRQRLASFKKPEVIHFVAELPKNQMGKVLRRELRARVEGA